MGMILGGDVGGTKVRLSLFEEKNGVNCAYEEKYASKEFPDFSSLLRTFLKGCPHEKLAAACFGVAGPVQDGICRATNLPWIISAEALSHELKTRVYLLNDLEANAYGLKCLSPEEFLTVNQGVEAVGNQTLIAAGTGLGEAGLYWNGKTHLPFACEGGHCDFGPKGEEEIALLRYLTQQFDSVSYERILSGAGLYHLYRFLVDTRRCEGDPLIETLSLQSEPQRLISERAVAKASEACIRAVEMFLSIYGSEAGNLVLKHMAVGGVFIGGGIAPHLAPLFNDGTFLKAFVFKGRFTPVLQKIPVKVVLNEKTVLLGAARYGREKALENDTRR